MANPQGLTICTDCVTRCADYFDDMPDIPEMPDSPGDKTGPSMKSAVRLKRLAAELDARSIYVLATMRYLASRQDYLTALGVARHFHSELCEALTLQDLIARRVDPGRWPKGEFDYTFYALQHVQEARDALFAHGQRRLLLLPMHPDGLSVDRPAIDAVGKSLQALVTIVINRLTEARSSKPPD